MHSLIELLNRAGRTALDFAWPLFWQSSLLIGVLLLADGVLRRRARAVLRYALWLLVLFKLLLPPSLALPTGLGYWLGTHPVPVSPPSPPPAVSIVVGSGAMPLPTASTPVTPIPPKLNRHGGLLLVWLAGSTLLLSLLVRRSWQATQIHRQARAAKEEWQSCLEDCGRRLGLRDQVSLKLVPSACSPAVCGLWRPVVLLPQQLADGLPPDQFRAVLLHELIHVRRHDVWVNCLQALLQVVYWWHPLVWLANARIRRVREEAVDEAVMVALGSQAEAYPATLLEVAKLAFVRPLTALGLVGIFESRGALQQRIRRLLDRPTPRSAKLNLAGLLAVVACGALLLPMARGHRAAALPPSAPEPLPRPPAVAGPVPSVLLDCRILELTDEAWQSLPLGSPSLVGPKGVQVWVPDANGIAALSSAWSNHPGIFLLARPRLGTLSGQAGSISVTRATNLNSETLHLGTVCELTPRVVGTQVDVAIRATLTEISEAQEGDEGRPVPTGGRQISRELANLQVAVPDGGIAVIHSPGARTSEGRHRLFVVGAVIVPESSRANEAVTLPAPLVPQEGRPRPGTPAAETVPLPAPAEEAIPRPPLPPRPGQESEFSGVTSLAVDDRLRLVATTSEASKRALATRMFKVDARTFAEALTNSPSLAGRSLTEAFRGFLEAAGVSVAPPNEVYYTQGRGVLMVKASAEELNRIASALEVLNKAPQQITLDAKFIEAPEAFVKPINWGTIVSGADATNEIRILSDTQAQEFLQALRQTPGVDVMATPRVTTLSGRQAQIQQVEIKTVLTGMDPSAVAAPGRTAADVTNPSPFLSKPVPVGPTLDLIPTVAEDGYTVELTTIASLVEFLGYGKPTNTVAAFVNGKKQDVEPPLPVVRTRQASGRASLYDGQSLLLIGPAAAVTNRFVDRVPVLGDVPGVGRLFRHEGTSTVNKHLLILVTPTLIDPAGNPIHAPGDLPFDPNSVPPQPK
jgi:beta-lactamase regulating signal transducer with metallopeptidase domain/type II secretory pathway component GspD/PulD (secretin)